MPEAPHEPTELEILESKLNAELKKWEVLGIDPATWAPSQGMLGIILRLDVLNEVLEEAGILLPEEEMNKKMMCLTEARLKAIREELEPQIQQAKLNMIKNGNLPRGMH